MRLSCNGCRILRKGCNDSCTLRPCLEWITSAEAQANATLFLAKFYGRSGLMKLLNSGPNHLRPIIFRSLLYEACGRIVNPVYGSVGLQWSGNWHLCQAAVESVLKGHPLPIDGNVPESSDIKPSLSQLIDSTSTDKPLKPKNRGRFKRPLHRKSKTHGDKLCNFKSDSQGCNLKWQDSYLKEFESMFQIVQEENVRKAGCNNNESATFSAEDTAKADANGEHAKIQGEAAREDPVQEMFYKSISEMENFSDDSNYSKEIDDENGVELELTLGSPVSVETVQPHDFIPCNRHWSSISSCKESSPLINMASLSLALSHPA